MNGLGRFRRRRVIRAFAFAFAISLPLDRRVEIKNLMDRRIVLDNRLCYTDERPRSEFRFAPLLAAFPVML